MKLYFIEEFIKACECLKRQKENKQITRRYKARVTINGQRINVGLFNSKEDAEKAMLDEYAKHNVSVPKKFYRSGSGRVKNIGGI